MLGKLEDPFKDIELLKLVTPENREFLSKQIVPAYMRNHKALELEHSLSSVIKALNEGNIDCLDKLAANAQLYKIGGSSDTLIMLETLTKENKDFAFNELFPYLIENAQMYKIERGGNLAQYLKVITPQNKEFMLKEAIPEVLANASKIGIGNNKIASVAGLLDQNNIKKLKTIADNAEKLTIRDESGFLDLNKLAEYLKKDSKELLG